MSVRTYKFTKDGKKVAVLGKLNSEEFIVQEVFISGGQEIPAGENFVAKGLLDAPAKSWKEDRIKALEDRYERDRDNWERRISELNRNMAAIHKKAELRAKSLFSFCENSECEQIQTLIDFVSGNITHAFVDSYDRKIVEINDDFFFQLRDGGAIEEMKLISLFGRSNGDLAFRLHQYSDGSGGTHYQVYLANSYEAALKIAQDNFDSLCEKWMDEKCTNISLDSWSSIEGLVVPGNVAHKAAAIKEKFRAERIKKLREELKKLEEQQ